MIPRRDMMFGRIAVKNGFMTSTQLNECVDILKQRISINSDASLESIAVQKEYLTPEQISAIAIAVNRITKDSEKRALSVVGYEIISKIGEGGIGVVYKARQLSMNRIVALKILHKRLVKDEEFRKRFLLEARLAGKLSHPNLLDVYDVGKEGWKYYFSMEFIEGESVEDILTQSGKMLPIAAIDIALQVAKAIKYLKEHNIVHCDIKPGNILIAKDGTAKLGDFGFVRIGMELNLSDENSVLGTPEYISPEQATGEKNIDFRSDLYSLAVTLYHMLTGKPPYEGTSGIIMQKHVKGELPDPLSINPSLSQETCAVLKKTLERDPNDRYQTVDAFIEELTAARMAEDPYGMDDVTFENGSSVVSVLKKERFLSQKHSNRVTELERKMKIFKIHFLLALAVLALSVILNLYLFIKYLWN
ncbi:MAG: serine/threonine-protein kinase [Planctomycetota bacterium]